MKRKARCVPRRGISIEYMYIIIFGVPDLLLSSGVVRPNTRNYKDSGYLKTVHGMIYFFVSYKS